MLALLADLAVPRGRGTGRLVRRWLLFPRTGRPRRTFAVFGPGSITARPIVAGPIVPVVSRPIVAGSICLGSIVTRTP